MTATHRSTLDTPPPPLAMPTPTPTPAPLATAMAAAEQGSSHAERTRLRVHVLTAMSDPERTEYFKTKVRDLDTAIHLGRADWCLWLVTMVPGYGNLATEGERAHYGRSNKKYIRLNELLAQGVECKA